MYIQGSSPPFHAIIDKIVSQIVSQYKEMRIAYKFHQNSPRIVKQLNEVTIKNLKI